MAVNKELVEQLALANGFKLKEQPDGSKALNPYVFDFAKALAEHSAQVLGQPVCKTEAELSLTFEEWHKQTRHAKKWALRYSKTVTPDDQVNYHDVRTQVAFYNWYHGYKAGNGRK